MIGDQGWPEFGPVIVLTRAGGHAACAPSDVYAMTETRAGAQARAPETKVTRSEIAVGLLLACLPGLLLAGYYYTRLFAGLVQPQAMEVAQVARHIAAGHGFATSSLMPLGAAQVARPELATGPAPLPALALGLVFAALGASDQAAAAVCLAGYLGGCLAVFALGARAFGLRTAIYGTLLYSLGAALLGAAISGLPVTMAAAAVTAAFLAGLRAVEGGGRRWPVLAGAAVGAAWLTGLVTPLAAVVLAGWLWLARGRRAALWGVAGALGLMLPWAVRTWLVTGHPLGLGRFGLVMWTPSYPGTSLLRSWRPELTLAEAARGHGWELMLKVLGGLQVVLGSLAAVGGVAVLVLAASSLFLRVRPPVGLLRLAFVALAVLTALGAAAVLPAMDYLLPLAGVGAVLAGAALVWLAQTRTHPTLSRALVAAALLITGYQAGLQALGASLFPPGENEMRQTVRALQARLGPGLVATDVPWAVAWYGNRPALGLPTDPRSLQALAGRGRRAEYLFLSPLLLRAGAQEGLGYWQRVIAGQYSPAGYDRMPEWHRGALFRLRRPAGEGGAEPRRIPQERR